MLLKLLICFLCCGIVSTSTGNEDVKKLLFAFGDSYADTGNLPSISVSWRPPYGTTFPGKPSGRFSDGRVLTDYVASFFGVRPPLAYRRIQNLSAVENGINFAHGGTGVFQTLFDLPNMTTQIDFFQQLIEKNVFGSDDLSSSIALVSLAGNDYAAYLARNGTFQGLEGFSRSVINQLMLNVRRLNRFGMKKIFVSGIGPLGCLPQSTASNSYQNCNAALNNFSISHNQLVEQNIFQLNLEAAAPVFTYLDLYTGLMSALGGVPNRLKPCCAGECGAVDKNGKNKYVVCENRSRSIFWDSIHPSNFGWNAVFSALDKSFLI
ncbi:GDSL esterase/lipase At5g03610-like isoform X2 [Salvia miltiorrhiza]|uniref:GDSL esterase/lipase At5g03610-like isoform X2 n=1 Tax=Salvia miltiorrhiza TaxID=226208 RepID=UPI0025AD0A4F|nr:GDSL esterase/lipase At5g03610-like isoform X2 [Salvia miltiorrhiza]